MKATAIANSNIALVKYWGKRDNKLGLPMNTSISMTLDQLRTTTTLEFLPGLKKDTLKIDGKKATSAEIGRMEKFLNAVRKLHGEPVFARVESENSFPKAAGLASSASAFAALALASTKALGLDLTKKELSILARQGSGSACRSIEGGFVEWKKGSLQNGSDSYGRPIAPKEHWPELCMVVTVITEKEKRISSENAMEKTTETSPLYRAWLETAEKDARIAKQAILEKDFNTLGRLAEMNCLKMHSAMLTTEPHIIYWEPETITVMKEVVALRESGLPCYFTIDGGPQVKILCLEKDAKKIEKFASYLPGVKKTFLCHAGEEAKLSRKGLF